MDEMVVPAGKVTLWPFDLDDARACIGKPAGSKWRRDCLLERHNHNPIEIRHFATLGFWQGVDIPGRALSLVTIDRLPFPRPDDPLLQARRDRAGGRAFSVVDLPRAATMLAQGSGRLIRNAQDRGVVAVLDPRLATASYRGVLLATLPPMRRSVDISEVESFLRRALEDGA